MKTKVVIDYSKIPEGILKSQELNEDVKEYNEYKEKDVTIREYVEMIQHYMESKEVINLIFLNMYIGTEPQIKLIDCIDFENSRILIANQMEKN